MARRPLPAAACAVAFRNYWVHNRNLIDARGVIMRELMTLFFPIGAVLFLLAYVFLVNPQSLYEFGYWLQKFF
jgi:hypothetical protein